DADRLLTGFTVLRTLATITVAGAVTWSVRAGAWGELWLIGWLLLSVLLLLFVRVEMRALALRQPLDTALRLARPLRWLLILIAPLIWPVWRRARRLEPADTLSVRSILLTEEGLRLLLRFGAEEPLIEEDEREMIDGIVRLGDKTVAEVMVPRVDVVALPVDATLEEALDVCVTSGHSRIPVYEDTIDRIVGVLYAKDLLTHFRARFLEGKSGFALRELMRKPYFVPESALVGDLLSELQHKKTHLAIVVDEYGGTAGIVTIEDLLEEIVGEIQDEYDFEAPLIQQVEPQVYLISGRANIDDVNRELGLSLTDEDESYTLAGVIYSHLQRVPDVGDKVELDDAQLEVVSVNDNRIAQVRVVLKQPSGETTAGNTVA
ncbi:MAG: hemolysin family protein, partial [Anaerolineae bacterium]|nr:hemolysin family protein [Anaerolineae bacterium]